MRKYKFDYHYFDEIDTPEKAYWLGFLYGDGYIINRWCGFGCALRESDKEHLVLFLQAIKCSSLDCLRYQAKTKAWRFQLCSTIFYNRLRELGFSVDKTYAQSREIFDNVPNSLKIDFLRGLWDANGYVAVSSEGCNLAGYVCSNEVLVQSLVDFINEDFGENFCRVVKNDSYPRIRLSAAKAKRFCDWLYKDRTPVLARKYEKYLLLRDCFYDQYIYHHIKRLKSGRYYTSIRHNGKTETIGTFNTVKEALENYNRKAKEYGTPTQKYLGEYLKKEENMETISLAMKWLPSINASSKETQELGRWFARQFGLSEKGYRVMLSKGRKKIHLLEQDMSAKRWSEIQYDKLPSQAFRKHTKAFARNDKERYSEFIHAVNSGDKKVNTSTVTTAEVIQNVRSGDNDSANAIWKSLDNFVPEDLNAIVVADVSGSMTGRPMDISTSLALYFAERNKGYFANKFLTFSAQPRLVEILGDTLTQKLRNIETAEWGMNTNIHAVFDVLLRTAVESGDKVNVPKVIYIISDMEFDDCATGASQTAFDLARQAWNRAGLELPTVVFWNVNSRSQNLPATNFNKNVTLISGSSQSAFRFAFEGKTPSDLMHEVVDSERYLPITA